MKKKFVYAGMVVMLILAFTISTVGANAPLPLNPVDWDRLVPLEQDGFAAQADQALYTEGDVGVDTMPIPLYPAFEVSYDKKPIFHFTRDYIASKYEIALLDIETADLESYIAAGSCASYSCSIQWPEKLEPAGMYHQGVYRWSISAKEGITWTMWSNPADFQLRMKKFNDSFDVVPEKWESVYGDWYWIENKGIIKNDPLSGYWNSMIRDGYFVDVDYTVMMKRKNNFTSPNAIIIGGDPSPMAPDGSWKNGVYFQYSNDGYYAIWKNVGGTWTWIHSWDYSAAINPYGWNELRIVATYPYFDVWINGTYLGWWKDTDAVDSGYNGVSMFGEANDEVLLVDYARANIVQYTGLAERDPSMQLGLEPAPEGMSPTSAPVTWDKNGTR